MDMDRLTENLKRHEGSVRNAQGRHVAYEDSVGVVTVCYGRNADDRGFSEDEAEYLLENDICYFWHELTRQRPVVLALKPVRQEALVNMAFNLGIYGIDQFEKMWDAISRASYREAAREMMNSKWASQVGQRAKDLAYIMEHGEYEGKGK